ncbi:unnamed protein product [Soboliphyme baturini]|uniref:Secreted protein n=1 Tax=Soboliphyme baturini TaxID=241478 RepID=A0A183J1Y6_9BILA|nr:unnamed protein product [Soboliphyme baturini]
MVRNSASTKTGRQTENAMIGMITCLASVQNNVSGMTDVSQVSLRGRMKLSSYGPKPCEPLVKPAARTARVNDRVRRRTCAAASVNVQMGGHGEWKRQTALTRHRQRLP